MILLVLFEQKGIKLLRSTPNKISMTSVPDQADIHKRCTSRIRGDRMDAAKLFNGYFPSLPDKSEAWQDLVSLSYDEDNNVRSSAAEALVSAFVYVPDKTQAGRDIHRFIQDEDRYIVFREAYARGLSKIFHLFPDKEQAWQDLHKLTKDDSIEVRLMAVNTIGEFFSIAPNKDEVWQDLRRLLIQHEDFRELGITTRAIVKIFSCLPDKAQAWQDFVTLAEGGGGRLVRSNAARTLVSVFVHVPDKNQAWQDFVRIASVGGAGGNQSIFAQALGLTIAYVPDKERAWQDLVKLTGDEYIFVRSYAAEALGTAFIHVLDKNQAGEVLHDLAHDKDDKVRSSIAYAIGSVFSCIPDKDEAWQDLVNLAQDSNRGVQTNAYHSLGRASIYKATLAKDNCTLKRELEYAVNYFENSPTRFCYLFYRSYYAITFQEANEVQRYLEEARRVVGSSKSKDELLLAVENLARALREAQSQRDRPLQENVSDLNSYRWYCEKAAEHMAAVEDKAPGAVEFMRKCNPLLDDNIQATIAVIQEKAILISPEVAREAGCLSQDDPIKVHQSCIRTASALRDPKIHLPKEKKKWVCGVLSDIEKEGELSFLLGKIKSAMTYVLHALEAQRKEIFDLLKNIESRMVNLSICSGSTGRDLNELKTMVQSFQDKIATQELNREDLNKILKDHDCAILEKTRNEWLGRAEEMAKDLLSLDDKVESLKEILRLKQSRTRDILGIMGDFSSIIGLLLNLLV